MPDDQEQRAVAVVERSPAPVGVFGNDSPAAIVQRVADIAAPLGQFIRDHEMCKVLESAAAREKRLRERPNDKPREYVFMEGWSFLGQMIKVAAVPRSVTEMRAPDGTLVGFEAYVELVTPDGTVVGSGIGECSWLEPPWRNRDAYAVKSMAQTRATGKAYRLNYGFIMAAAGFDPTPAEEMQGVIEAEVVDDADQRPDNERRDVRRAGRPAPTPPQPRDEPGQWEHGATVFLDRCYNGLGLNPDQVHEALGVKNPSELITMAKEIGWQRMAAEIAAKHPKEEAAAKAQEVTA